MKKIGIGCGILALVIIGIGVGIGVFGVRWVKQQIVETERLQRVMEQMESAYGKPEDFQPPYDGIYPVDRVRLFVRMRGELMTAGEDFRIEVENNAREKSKGWWKRFRAVGTLVNEGAGYLATADSLLLVAGMSQGEYAHYQTLMLHGFLGESPIVFLDESPDPEEESSFHNTFGNMVEQYMEDAQSLMQQQARNARDAAGETGPQCAACAEWVVYLDDQLENSRSHRAHIAMTDPLAPSVAEALSDNRYELEAMRPTDYGTWLLAILMVMELDDDGNGFKLEIGN